MLRLGEHARREAGAADALPQGLLHGDHGEEAREDHLIAAHLEEVQCVVLQNVLHNGGGREDGEEAAGTVLVFSRHFVVVELIAVDRLVLLAGRLVWDPFTGGRGRGRVFVKKVVAFEEGHLLADGRLLQTEVADKAPVGGVSTAVVDDLVDGQMKFVVVVSITFPTVGGHCRNGLGAFGLPLLTRLGEVVFVDELFQVQHLVRVL